MTLIAPDKIDAAMAELPARPKVWGTADYEDEIERLTINLISSQHATKVAGETISKLRRDVANLNTAAETAAATWEREIRGWQVATVGMGIALVLVVGGWWWKLSKAVMP